MCICTCNYKCLICDDDADDFDSNPSIPNALPEDTEQDDADADLEPWVDWIKRCTHDVEQRMKELKLDDWVTMQRRRKWKWGQKPALFDNFDWTTAVLRWDPTLVPQLHSRRRPGRPKTC